MTLRATPMTLAHWSTSAGRFGTAAITTSSRGRATTVLVGASTASYVLSPSSAFFSVTASTFPVTTATAGAGGVHIVACVGGVGPLFTIYKISVMPISNSIDNFITAAAVT